MRGAFDASLRLPNWPISEISPSNTSIELVNQHHFLGVLMAHFEYMYIYRERQLALNKSTNEFSLLEIDILKYYKNDLIHNACKQVQF